MIAFSAYLLANLVPRNVLSCTVQSFLDALLEKKLQLSCITGLALVQPSRSPRSGTPDYCVVNYVDSPGFYGINLI